jgi:hypothetical protein
MSEDLSKLRPSHPEATFSDRSDIPNQVPDPYAQRISDGLERAQGHALTAAFNPVNVSAIKAGTFREDDLGQAFFFPQFADDRPDNDLDVLQ